MRRRKILITSIRKSIALALVLAMTMTLVACGGGSDSSSNGSLANSGESNVSTETPDYINTESEFPIVTEGTDITLTVMVVEGTYYANMDSIEEVYTIGAYEELTGVNIEWVEVSSDAFDDQLALRLANGDMPDIILKSGLSNSSQLKYGEQGYFLNLMENDLLENYAPNYWALTQEYPEILSSSMMADGSVYSLGLVRNSTGSTVASKLFFNQEWLDNLGLSVPTTADEFYDVLYSFKYDDPNGNGIQDEVGLYIKPDHLQMTTFGMFGIGNRGHNNGYIDYDEENDCVRYFATSDGFREWVEWVAKLYDEGLINQEYFDFTESSLGNYINNDVCGAFGYTNMCMISEETQEKFTYLDGAMEGDNGDNDYYGVNSIGSTGAYIITTACEYPEVALRWADYFYSEEGALFYYYGDEGVTYEVQDDGTYQYTDSVLSGYYDGTESYDGCATKVSLYAYGYSPTITQVPYNSADDNRGISLDAANALIEDCAIAWPNFTFTTEEQRIIEDNKGDIDTYVASMRDAWIMGTEELNDESWEQYIKTINNMGLEEVLEVYEAALERAYENGFEEGMHTLDEFDS